MQKTEAHYYNNTYDAFCEGFYKNHGTKRMSCGDADIYYDKYHYFLPAYMSKMIKFFRKYFGGLNYLEDPPLHAKIRLTHEEFAETAIEILHHLHVRLSVNGTLVLGSGDICPLTWAIIGHNIERTNSQLHLRDMRDVFHHYQTRLWCKGYNIIRVYRPQNILSDKLKLMSDAYGYSENFILGTAFLFLYDVISHCGPDCQEFQSVWTNNKHLRFEQCYPTWADIRKKVIPPEVDFGPYKCNGKYFPSGQYYVKRSPEYYEVELEDVPFDSLSSGEKVLIYSEFVEDSWQYGDGIDMDPVILLKLEEIDSSWMPL